MRSLLILTLTALSLLTGAQIFWDNEDYRPISTAADYLLTAPDARSNGMGQQGVASLPDLYSMYWNPAKYAFLDDRFGIAVSFSDYIWMKEMWKWNDDINLKIGFNVIAEGMDPDVSVCKGMIQSWYDAPGGFEEEIREWAVGGGFEYRYKTFLMARTGIFYENKTKGGRQFLTAGAGFKVGLFGMDFGLLIPLEFKMTDSYLAIFYFRTSVAFGLQGKP